MHEFVTSIYAEISGNKNNNSHLSENCQQEAVTNTF